MDFDIRIILSTVWRFEVKTIIDFTDYCLIVALDE